jgi:hypothetical protein
MAFNKTLLECSGCLWENKTVVEFPNGSRETSRTCGHSDSEYITAEGGHDFKSCGEMRNDVTACGRQAILFEAGPVKA